MVKQQDLAKSICKLFGKNKNMGLNQPYCQL